MQCTHAEAKKAQGQELSHWEGKNYSIAEEYQVEYLLVYIQSFKKMVARSIAIKIVVNQDADFDMHPIFNEK